MKKIGRVVGIAVLGVSSILSLTGSAGTATCSQVRSWDAVMVSGSQTSGQSKFSLSQEWTIIHASGRPCGPRLRYTVTDICVSNDDGIQFVSNSEGLGQIVSWNAHMIPIETGVSGRCVEDRLRLVFEPIVLGR